MKRAISGPFLIYQYVREILPAVDDEMKRWIEKAKSISDPSLRQEALSSIKLKKFHVQGGAVFALYPGADRHRAIHFILALQTISDYLDNLCDRMGIKDEAAFRQLHRSMLCAVSPESELSDFYSIFPVKEDNGYLELLVNTCRNEVAALPSYGLVSGLMEKYVQLYSDLQSLKHLENQVRENRILEWCRQNNPFPGLQPMEFAAATGSTLGMFILFCAASDPTLNASTVARIDSVYFPWICGIHILLDYYIDLEEDERTDELNFVQFYSNKEVALQRLQTICREASLRCGMLPYPLFHRTVIQGLLTLYLSDEKALTGSNRRGSMALLSMGGYAARLYFCLCRHLRKRESI